MESKLSHYNKKSLSLENLEVRVSNKRLLSSIKKIIYKARSSAKGLSDRFTNAHVRVTARSSL